MLVSYLWRDKLDYGGTQGLHTAVVIGVVKWTNTTVYLYKSQSILHQLRFFPVHCIISPFCNNEFFFLFSLPFSLKKIQYAKMICIVICWEKLRKSQKPNFCPHPPQKKGYKFILFTQNFETSEKKTHWLTI